MLNPEYQDFIPSCLGLRFGPSQTETEQNPGRSSSVTLARYAILVEGGTNVGVRRQLAETGSRVNAWFANWLRLIGSRDPDRDLHVVGNYLTGLMLHQLAMPDPGFDPADRITALLESLVRPGLNGGTDGPR